MPCISHVLWVDKSVDIQTYSTHRRDRPHTFKDELETLVVSFFSVRHKERCLSYVAVLVVRSKQEHNGVDLEQHRANARACGHGAVSL